MQCGIAMRAGHRLDAAMEAGDVEGVWDAIQGILIAGANLSKMFWGSRGRRETARAPLRESLGIAASSPLRDTALRNDFEHFDERIEDWCKSSTTLLFIDRNIGPPHALIVPSEYEGDRSRHYDPITGIVTFWQHSVNLPELVAEIARILPRAANEARRPHWM
jgi:hypothetical protein